MRECVWPRGCGLPPSSLAGEGAEDGLCYYHWKMKEGLFDPLDITVAGRKTIRDSDVVSDEQRELAAALQKLGASPDLIRSAIAKEVPGRLRFV